MIIYEKTNGALVPSSGRSVTSFESGLCRVDQVYTCTDISSSANRIELAVGNSMPDGNDSPCIDGLFIYPSPQETKRQDGFVDFVVSAYGRTHSEIKNYQVRSLPYRMANPNADVRFSLNELQGMITIRRGSTLTINDLGLDLSIFDPFGFWLNSTSTFTSISTTNGGAFTRSNWDGSPILYTVYNVATVVDVGGIPTLGDFSYYTPKITVQNIRNFGEFQEMDILISVDTVGASRSDVATT